MYRNAEIRWAVLILLNVTHCITTESFRRFITCSMRRS